MEIVNVDRAYRWTRETHIYTGYRINGNYQTCLYSLFQWHNETINAWTMVLISMFTVCSFYYMLFNYILQPFDLIVFSAFTMSTLIHLPFSVGYHLFCGIGDESVYTIWLKMDTSTVFVSCFLHIFCLSAYTFSTVTTWIITMISLLISGLSIYRLIELPRGSKLDKVKHTQLVSGSVGLLMVPLVYRCFQDLSLRDLSCLMISCCSLAVGGLFYCCRIPERFFPRRFDYCGNSHNIMHLGLFVAIVCEFLFIYEGFKNERLDRLLIQR